MYMPRSEHMQHIDGLAHQANNIRQEIYNVRRKSEYLDILIQDYERKIEVFEVQMRLQRATETDDNYSVTYRNMQRKMHAHMHNLARARAGLAKALADIEEYRQTAEYYDQLIREGQQYLMEQLNQDMEVDPDVTLMCDVCMDWKDAATCHGCPATCKANICHECYCNLVQRCCVLCRAPY